MVFTGFNMRGPSSSGIGVWDGWPTIAVSSCSRVWVGHGRSTEDEMSQNCRCYFDRWLDHRELVPDGVQQVPRWPTLTFLAFSVAKTNQTS